MGRKSKNVVTAEGVTLRPCAKCRDLKTLDCFFICDGGCSAYCKPCQLSITGPATKARYHKNLAASRAAGRASQAKSTAAKVAFIKSIKEKTPCADCGNFYPPICMDFDHLPGVKKVADIAQMRGGFSLEEIKAEIQKCQVVCANCHRLRTWSRPFRRKAS